jgi:hypothetical protein
MLHHLVALTSRLAPSAPLVLSIPQPGRRRLRSSDSKLFRRRRRLTRRPRRNENWRRKPRPRPRLKQRQRLKLRLLRLRLRLPRQRKLLKQLKPRRPLRQPRRQQSPRLRLPRQPTVSRRCPSETVSPESLPPSQEPTKLQAGALLPTISEALVEVDLEVVVAAVVVVFGKRGLDLFDPTDPLLNNLPPTMLSLLPPQSKMTAGAR